MRTLFVVEAEPTAANFPYARSIVAVECERTQKKTGEVQRDTRYFISSHYCDELNPESWLNLIRGHWGGVESRNHWRRDACWGEDKTRSRNPNILANLALFRSALIRLLTHHWPGESFPSLFGSFARNPKSAMNAIFKHL